MKKRLEIKQQDIRGNPKLNITKIKRILKLQLCLYFSYLSSCKLYQMCDNHIIWHINYLSRDFHMAKCHLYYFKNINSTLIKKNVNSTEKICNSRFELS